MSAVFFGIFGGFTALELPLLVVRKLFPQTEGILPLGGDEFTQVAILVMSALFTAQVVWLGHHSAKFVQRFRQRKNDRLLPPTRESLRSNEPTAIQAASISHDTIDEILQFVEVKPNQSVLESGCPQSGSSVKASSARAKKAKVNGKQTDISAATSITTEHRLPPSF
jgi:hypothetical protein